MDDVSAVWNVCNFDIFLIDHSINERNESVLNGIYTTSNDTKQTHNNSKNIV